MKRGVFLDRDGTLIEEVGYLDRIDRVRFFPYSVDAVRLLNRAGFMVIVATNQAGIARGYLRRGVRRGHASIARRDARGRRRARRRRSISVRIIPKRRSRPTGRRASAASRSRACSGARRPIIRSTSGVRSSSATARTTSRPGRPSARSGVLVRTGYGDQRRTLGPRRRGGHRQSHGRRFLDSADNRDPTPSVATDRAARRAVVDPGRLLELVDEFAKAARRRLRRSHRRRVHLRRAVARLARGAGPHPRLRLDRHRSRRRRERGEQRGCARRCAGGGRRRRPRRDRPAAARRHAARAWTSAAVSPARRLPDADQDAHPRRRRALRQAAGRPHRSRHAAVVFRRRTAGDRVTAAARPAPAPTRSSSPTTARAW